MKSYTYLNNLLNQVPDIPPDSIISRTIYQDDQIKAVLFGFAPGQELSEHTASKPAVLHFLEGEAHIKLGETWLEAQAGTWVHLPPLLAHSIQAKTKLVMLLLLL